jgi:hypothetical protein
MFSWPSSCPSIGVDILGPASLTLRILIRSPNPFPEPTPLQHRDYFPERLWRVHDSCATGIPKGYPVLMAVGANNLAG